jgi:WD40 repeat protein
MLVWQAHKGGIEPAAFSPDGALLATATGDTRAPHLWESATGKLVRTVEGASGRVQSVCFASGAKLFAAGTSWNVYVWDTETWTVVAELAMSSASELAFGPGAAPVLVASGADNTVLWEEAKRRTFGGADRRAHDRQISCARGVAALDISPDGTRLATSNPGVTELWRVADARHLRTLRSESTNSRGAVRFSPDGQRLALAYGGRVEVWSVADKSGPPAKFGAATGRKPLVWTINWAPDSKVLLTAGNDGCVRVWDGATGAELRSFDWDIGNIYCATFSSDGLTCAACSDKGQVVVWDVDA